MTALAVKAIVPELDSEAAALAEELALPLLSGEPASDCVALLQLTPQGLELLPLGKNAPGSIRVDFGGGGMRHRRRSGHNEPLGRAVGLGKWDTTTVVDATAGLGRDAFVLADLGCEVELLERAPAAFALLREGLKRGLDGGDPWLRGVCARMQLQFTDARSWLAERGPAYCDVIYMDPMFPERKKSARVKKDMWLFQQLLASEPDDAGLLQQALQSARRRVVVKRPAKAAALDGLPPDFVIPGKTVRFDVYQRQTVNGHPPG